MNFFKRITPLVLGIVLVTGSAFAQGQQMQTTQADSVSDEELKQFVETTQDFQAISQEINGEVEKLVQDTEVDFERFQRIMMSKQNPQMAQDLETTDKEEQIIQDLQPEIQKLSQKAQEQQMQAVEDNGLSLQRFQEIAKAVQSDPEMMQRFRSMASDTAGDGQ